MSPRMGLDLAAVLETAARLADREGIDAVTLARLAKELTIRTPSLYNHVDGLGGLRSKLAVYGLEQLYAALVQAAVGRSGAEAVHAIASAYADFARRRPGLYETTLRAPDKDNEAMQLHGAKLVDLLVRLLAAYGLQGDAALHGVRGLRSLLHGFVSLEQRGAFGLPLDLDTTLHLLVDTFLAGIEQMKQGEHS